ncbi:VOC family protein [Comamonas kerstersii]
MACSNSRQPHRHSTPSGRVTAWLEASTYTPRMVYCNKNPEMSNFSRKPLARLAKFGNHPGPDTPRHAADGGASARRAAFHPLQRLYAGADGGLSPEQVDAAVAAALAHGGTQRERGGMRMYSAYVRDPAGHKLCLIYRAA